MNPVAAAIATNAFLLKRLPDPGQGTTQVGPGATLLARWPQELGEIAPVALSSLGGQVAQEGERLLPAEPEAPSLEAYLGVPSNLILSGSIPGPPLCVSRATLSQRPAVTVASVGCA